MLWRPSYQPRVWRDIVLPANTPDVQILLGGFDLLARGEIGIWQRLLDQCGYSDQYSILLIAPERLSRVQRDALIVFPRSDHSRLRFLLDNPLPEDSTSLAWSSVIQPDRPERSFAAVRHGSAATFLVVGPPTEEVWDEFQSVVSDQSLDR